MDAMHGPCGRITFAPKQRDTKMRVELKLTSVEMVPYETGRVSFDFHLQKFNQLCLQKAEFRLGNSYHSQTRYISPV